MNPAVNVEELLARLESDTLSVGSKMQLRSETIQQKNRLSRIEFLVKEAKRRAKILIPKEVAINFDPRDGSTKVYNDDNKFRLTMSVTTAFKLMKLWAHKNGEVKDTFMRRANVKEWNTENTGEINKDDEHVFRLYLVPRIFTVPVVHINNSTVTGREKYGADYQISVKRDPITGELQGETPVLLQINKLQREVAYEEWQHLEDCKAKAAKGERVTLLSNNPMARGLDLGTVNETDWKEVRRKNFDQIDVGDDQPSNYIICYEIGLTNDLTIDNATQYNSITQEEANKKARLVRINKKIKDAIGNYQNGTFKTTDRHRDFWELDMVCPMEDTGEGSIGRDTTYPQPTSRLYDETYFETVTNALRDDLDKSEDIEERFLVSARIRKVDADLERRVIDWTSRSFNLENPFLTQKVIRSNSDIISLVFGEEGDAKILEIEVGMSEAQEGSLDEKGAAAASKEFNLNRIIEEEEDAVEEEEPDLVLEDDKNAGKNIVVDELVI